MELLLLAMRKRIRSSEIVFIPHADYVSRQKERPKKQQVLDYLKNRLDMLYQVEDGKKERIKLVFYVSRRYDLVVIALPEGKELKVITYYNYLKKPFRI